MLETNGFTNSLIDFFTNPPAGRDGAARAWTDAYLSYIALAQAGPTIFRSTLLDAEKRVSLETILVATFAKTYPGRTAADAATDFQNAFLTFWLTPLMIFTPIPGTIGILTLVPPTLAALLLPVLESNILLTGAAGSRTAAQRIASVFDAWTRTIIVTVTVTPPGTPVPTPLT